MVEVFRELRRVLRSDGTFWLNIGDSYASGEIGRHDHKQAAGTSAGTAAAGRSRIGAAMGAREQRKLSTGTKPKDLLGIPWMLAFALRDDGWWLRSEITWAKRAPMPESVTDRPTSATEKVFLLTKSARYFYDAEAVKEDSAESSGWAKQRANGQNTWKYNDSPERLAVTGQRIEGSTLETVGKRNMRNFWLLGPAPFAEAHFATFPPRIPEIAILAGTSERGVCPQCGAPWTRITNTKGETSTEKRNRLGYSEKRGAGGMLVVQNLDYAGGHGSYTRETETIGWRPTCSCGGTEVTVPPIVLDPFLGAGTTGMVADRLGRDCIGIELNGSYAEMADRRINADKIKRAA